MEIERDFVILMQQGLFSNPFWVFEPAAAKTVKCNAAFHIFKFSTFIFLCKNEYYHCIALFFGGRNDV